MIGEMTCPDCGGVVGATESSEAGDPCRCFADGPSGGSLSGASVAGTSVSGTLGGLGGSRYGASDLAASDLDVAPPPPPVVVVEKRCRICGVDVAGHRRLKDSLGYMCVPCAKAEELRQNQGRVACRVCGKLTKPENLSDYEGTKMCSKCHAERTTMRKEEIKRIGFKGARNRDELRQLYTILVVGGVLLFIILVGVVINHFRH